MKKCISLCFILIIPLFFLNAQSISDQDLYQQALEFEKNKEQIKALDLFEDVFKRNPGNASYYYKLRSVYFASAEYDKLYSILKIWVSKHSYDVNALAEMGILLYKNNQEKKAKDIWVKLLRKNKKTAARTLFLTLLSDLIGRPFSL